MNSAIRKNRVAGLIAGFSLHIRLGNAFDLSCMALPLEHSRIIVNGTKDPVGTALDCAQEKESVDRDCRRKTKNTELDR
jgi:hypothetical protein